MAEAYLRVTFERPWGHQSWRVHYQGAYTNARPPHVEVVRADGAVALSGGNPVRAGHQFSLVNLHRRGPAIAWEVQGLNFHDDPAQPAHFTVHYYWHLEDPGLFHCALFSLALGG